MSFDPTHGTDYISQVKLPGYSDPSSPYYQKTFWIKDSEARDWIQQLASAGIKFTIAWNGESAPDVTKIPLGVEVTYNGDTYTGTLVASADTASFITLVFSRTTGTAPNIRKVYDEYITVTEGSEEPYTYFWEKLGSTDINMDLGDLAYYDAVITTTTDDSVLGANTTFTAGSSAVTFSGGTIDTFVKSYPGSTNKLVTTSIKGVGEDVTFNAVASNTDYTATNTVFGTATSASKITPASKTATNLVLGTATEASKATAGTAVSVAKVASSATNVSRISLSSGNTSILETASVNNEVLSFGSASVTQSSVTGTNGTESITPYTFTPVTVPVVTSNDSVTFDAIGNIDSVTVPVVSSNDSVTTTKITIASKTVATSATNSTTVATGKTALSDTNGDTVLIGLGTAVTESAIKTLGTGTAAAQTITVGTNDLVDAVDSVTTTVSKRNN